MTNISSLQNKRIKQLVRLNSRRVRDAERLTLVEGVREVGYALQFGHQPREAYICPDIVSKTEGAEALVTQLRTLANFSQTELLTVTTAVFEKIAYRGQTGGILLVLPYWTHSLNEVLKRENPFLVVVEDAQKPGNVGAILRTADGAGATAVLSCCSSHHPSTDIFNPNVIRASLGTIFTQPVLPCSTSDAIDALQQRGIPIVIATPEAPQPFTAVSLKRPLAIVTGSEAFGLSEAWRDACEQQVSIPMLGVADSLNLSTATALMLYEVVRQEQEQKTAVVSLS